MRNGGTGAQPQNRRLLERLPLAAGRPLVGYAAAVAAVVVATLLRFPINLPEGYPFFTFFPAIVLVAFLFGPGAGAVAGLLSVLSVIYFFVRPFFSFAAESSAWLPILFFSGSTALIVALIHWLQKSNARLEEERRLSAALAENRELLFRELQHRVSNNLQVVAALLSLQKRHVGDDQARAALDEASRRLGLIGRIHRQLYEPSGQRIGISPFLSQLAADVVDSAGSPGVRLQLELDEALDLQADAAIPVALIVSEAISNAIEHGFAGREFGSIRVSMERIGSGGVALEVADDGPGVPAGFDPEQSLSLGLRIASTLARQLGGRFEMMNAGGALARLTLPPAAVSVRS